jgi:5-(carboxyamino)imidazole ribonucleotide synthase
VSNFTQTSGAINVGIVGAGQLARMMGECAHDAHVRVTVLALSPNDAAVATCDEVVIGEPTDARALDQLAHAVDVVTFDHELVDLDQIEGLERRGVVVRPSAKALRYAVDKAHQRRALSAAGLPLPRFEVVSSSAEHTLPAFLDEIGDDVVIKTARGGYDGRGVWFSTSRNETLALIDQLPGEVVVEERVELLGEVAQLVVRAVDGSVMLYPLVTTVQSERMCAEVRFPAEVSLETSRRAEELAEQLASLIDVVGILAIEFFVTPRGLVVNEVALRPHNSGHWTIEGTTSNQFANHLRAVSGQTLGAVRILHPCAVMVNVVGDDEPGSIEAAQHVPGVHVHDYGKSWRPGRKLGHVTVVGDDAQSAHVQAWKGARAYGTRTRET